MGEKRPQQYRWLHISDLHTLVNQQNESFLEWALYGNPNSPNVTEQKGLRGAIERAKGVDCIVITGDLFHQGKITEASKKKLKEILQKIYEICSNAGEWDWKKGENMERIIFCPGNHDLNRNVTYSSGKTRQQIIKDNSIKDDGYLRDHEQSEWLAELPFKECYRFVEEITGKKAKDNKFFFCHAPDISQNRRELTREKKPLRVMFGVLNTALTAGQRCTYEDYRKKNADASEKADAEQERLLEKRRECEEAKCYEEAKKTYSRYLQLWEILEGTVIEDEGKLLLPTEEHLEKCRRRFMDGEKCDIDTSQRASYKTIPIMIGHHPVSFFSVEAENQLKKLMRDTHTQLYLCGHTHTSSYGRTDVISDYSAWGTPIYQVGMGGMFFDDDKYNQMSFSVGCVSSTSQETDAYDVNIKTYLYQFGKAENVFGVWAEQEHYFRNLCGFAKNNR